MQRIDVGEPEVQQAAGQVGRPPGWLRPGDRPPTGEAARHVRHQAGGHGLPAGGCSTVGPARTTRRWPTSSSEVWLPSKEGRVEIATSTSTGGRSGRHIVPLIGGVRLRDLTAEVVDDWVGALTSRNEAGKPRLGRDLGPPRPQGPVHGAGGGGAAGPAGREPGGADPAAQARPGAPTKLGWTLEEAQRFLDVAPSIALRRRSTSAWSPGCAGASSWLFAGRRRPRAAPARRRPAARRRAGPARPQAAQDREPATGS